MIVTSPHPVLYFISQLPKLLRLSFRKLIVNDPLRMGGATAFFTSFALPFILILITQGLSLVFNAATIRKEIFDELAGIFGRQGMRQIVDTLVAFRHLAKNGFITVIGVLFLLLVSTTLLMVIKTSMNQLWSIRTVGKLSFLFRLGTRLQSVIIIIATGFLFLLGIAAEAIKAQLSQKLLHSFPHIGPPFLGLLNYILSVLFVTVWFGLIFRLLPDARAPWKVAFTGGFVTAILFILGKFVLRLLLINSNLKTLYGTSASIVLILLFVFYSSLIMYFGVAFTRVWADHKHVLIRPLSYAARYKLTQVDEQLDSIKI